MDGFRAKLPAYDGPQLYLVACAPKSGSTFAATLLSTYLGTGKFFAGKVPNRAVQDLDSTWIKEDVAAGKTVIHQHVPYHGTTLAYMQHYRMRPVVLVRDLADTVASIRDHLRAGGTGSWPDAHIDVTMLDRRDDELECTIAHLIMPWYFNFYAGWCESSRPMITYEQLMVDPACLFVTLGIAVDETRLAEALEQVQAMPTRRNKAMPGRGRAIAPEALDHLNRLAAHYSHLDLSPIMKYA